jgi:hypothetical protein
VTSFFRFVKNQTIYRLGIISLPYAAVHVTDFPVVNVHVDELSSARIWQHKLCATLSANVNINNRLPIKVYYRICTLRHIRIEIIHGSQNTNIRQPMLKLKTHSGFHDLFLNYSGTNDLFLIFGLQGGGNPATIDNQMWIKLTFLCSENHLTKIHSIICKKKEDGL